jgi:CRP-like cAMP-binding protein
MKRNSTLNHRSDALYKKLSPLALKRRYGDEQAIFWQGDTANAMFCVEQGYVKLAVTSGSSSKLAVTILREGDCFGEGCVGNPLRTCTATSINPSLIGRISRRALVTRLHEEPSFAKVFTAYLLLRIRRVEDDLVDQLMNSSERRLARLLVQISATHNGSVKGASVANIDQETLAQAVGTTRSRVSHFMNEFRNKGFIDYNGHLQVHRTLLTFLLYDKTSH